MNLPPIFKKLIPLLLILSAFMIFFPMLLGSKIINNGDIILLYLPAYKFLSDQPVLTYPIWYSGILSGIPIFATQFGLFFHPIYNLAVHFWGFIAAYNWLTFISFAVGTLSMYWLMMNLFQSRTAAIICASIFSFSQFNMAQIYYSTVVPLYYTLPLSFLFCLKIKRGKYLYLLPAIALWSSALLIGHPQFIFYTLLGCFLFNLFLDISEWKQNRSILGKLRATGLFIVIMVCAVAIAAPWILRSSNLISLTARSETKPISQIMPGALNIATLTNVVLPALNLPVIKYTCCGGHVPYVGILAIILAVSTFFKADKPKILFFFQGLFIVFFVMSLEIRPIIALIYKLPIFKLFLYPYRTIFISDFALAILAGYGIKYFFEFSLEKRYKLFAFLSKRVIALIAVGTVLISISLVVFRSTFYRLASYYVTKTTVETPADKIPALINQVLDKISWQFSFRNYDFIIALVFLIAPIAFFYFIDKKIVSQRNIRIAAVAFFIISPLLIWKNYYQYLPTDFINQTPKTISFIKNNNPELDFRIFDLQNTNNEYANRGLNLNDYKSILALRFEIMTPNSNIYYGISSINGYENFMSVRQSKLISLLGSERAQTGPSLLAGLPEGERISQFVTKQKIALLSMMNVKYVISSLELLPPFKKVYSSLLDKYKIPIYVYENPSYLPRIYFAQNVNFIPPNEEVALKTVTTILDFKKTAVIECSNNCKKGQYDRKSSLEINRLEPGLAIVKTKTNSASWLIFSESWFPGWLAFIDGQSAKIFTANYIYQAVNVPSGEHMIEFRYEPPPINFGFLR